MFQRPRALSGEVLLADESQGVLAFVETDIPTKRYEYAVLVTDLKHELLTISQLYRDLADSENTFDEMKNQWGWGGFTTHDLARCRLSAVAVALIYNWWSLFVRLGNPKAKAGGDYQPAVSAFFGGAPDHSWRRFTISPSPLSTPRRTKRNRCSPVLLDRLKVTAEQLKTKSVWQLVCEHILCTVPLSNPKSSAYYPLQPPSNCCF